MKLANKVILVFLGLSFPILGLGILFGLAGSTSEYYLLIAIGYFAGIIFSIIGFFKTKFIYGSFAGVALIVIGFTLDGIFWSDHNAQLCEELRAEPSCIEDETGFDCKNFKGIQFSTGKGICD